MADTNSWGSQTKAGVTIAGALGVENISKGFSGDCVLESLSFEVLPGKILCLLGESGCGKSTLLRIIAGVEPQDSGRILLDGREIAGETTFLPAEKRGIGLVFQDYALFPHMNVLTNVMFGLKGDGRKAIEKNAMAMLHRVGLEKYACYYPQALSGGQQQRVALARALVTRPRVLLMDEPFSSLDGRLRASVRQETLFVLQEMRATSIIVTHDAEEAMRLGDEILLIHKGKIEQSGTAHALYMTPKTPYVARFFGEINELEAQIDNECAQTPVGTFSAPGLASGVGRVFIRPSAVIPAAPGEGIPGRVIRRHFLGMTEMLEISAEGLNSPLIARVRPQHQAAPGQLVGLRFEARECFVFPQ